jgi:hypothetical protein
MFSHELQMVGAHASDAYECLSQDDLDAIANGSFQCKTTVHALIIAPDPSGFCRSRICRKRILRLAPYVKPRVREPLPDLRVSCLYGLGKHHQDIDCSRIDICRSYFVSYKIPSGVVEEFEGYANESDEELMALADEEAEDVKLYTCPEGGSVLEPVAEDFEDNQAEDFEDNQAEDFEDNLDGYN